jgi:hypothetical protein
MAWREIQRSRGFPYSRPSSRAAGSKSTYYCVVARWIQDPEEFSWPPRRAGEKQAVVQRTKRSRMLAKLMDTDQWLGERY